MDIKVERWAGSWWVDDCKVVRVTKTMVVVAVGAGEQRFNRRTGRFVGGPAGLLGMNNSSVPFAELRRLDLDESEKTY
jgi:hypothetical protein